jgi:hypothetical protein
VLGELWVGVPIIPVGTVEFVVEGSMGPGPWFQGWGGKLGGGAGFGNGSILGVHCLAEPSLKHGGELG